MNALCKIIGHRPSKSADGKLAKCARCGRPLGFRDRIEHK